LGKQFTLSASDSFKLGAYRADPAGTPKGGIVVIQEILASISISARCATTSPRKATPRWRRLCSIRTQKDFQSGYTPPEIEKARTFVAKPDWDAMMRDTEAAVKELSSVGPVGIIGFCMGGTIAFLGRTRLSGLSAAVGYYGGRIVAFADEKPKCPTQLHFGEKDASIPMTDVEIIKQKRPDVESSSTRTPATASIATSAAASTRTAATVAWKRTTDFFAKHMKK
jgi:carboxymethylenebutenolidase